MTELQQIAVNTIGKPLFDIRFYRDDRPLQTSIQNFGILNPPTLFLVEGTWRILDGVARIEIARQSGVEEIICLVSDFSAKKNEADLGLLFLRCLELNRWNRSYNIVEKAFILKMAHEIFGSQNIPKTFWSLVDINQNIRAIHQYKELMKLPHVVQKYAVMNSIALTVILGFLRFPANEIEKIAAQLFILPLNQNRLTEILGLLIDISKREAITPGKVMDDVMLRVESESNGAQKEQSLRRILHQRKNPHYETKLIDFEQKVQSLGVASTVKITPSPYFENDSIEVSTTLNSEEELQKFIESLKQKKWNSLFRKD